MNVTVNVFDPSELQRIAENLSAYLEDFENKANRACERLAEIGKTTATQGFADALYDGVNDVAVSVEPIQNGYAVHARGNSVLFIEFGAGVYYNGTGSYPGEIPPGVVGIGQYGQGHGKNDWWSYKGQLGNAGGVPSTKNPGLNLTHGNPPAQAMYNAQMEVERRAEEVANEVFNE